MILFLNTFCSTYILYVKLLYILWYVNIYGFENEKKILVWRKDFPENNIGSIIVENNVLNNINILHFLY